MTSVRPTRRPILVPLLATLLALAVAAAPAAAKKRGDAAAADAAHGAAAASRKTLAETVAGMEKVEGLVTFYRSPEKLLLVVPEELLDAPLGLAVSRVNAVGDFALRGSQIDNQLVRWERAGGHLLLVKENLNFRAGEGSSLGPAVEESFPDSPVFSAKLLDLAEPAPLVVDASGLFGPDLARVLAPQAGFSLSSEASVLTSLKSFPDNAVARVSYRARRQEGGGAGGGDDDHNPFQRFLRPGRLADDRFAEVVVDYNLFRLPDDGYRPRIADERIGGFTQEYKDYSEIDGADTLFRHVLLRWDVRKSDPAAAVSPAVEPITFTMDRSVPERWRPAVREAAEWWNAAFEKVGISGAVRVLDPPDDPDWDPADLRVSPIYWNLADNLVFSGAAGPSVSDPRTGKVLKANVWINGEFFSFALNRYLVYAWWRAPEPGSGEALGLADRRRALAELRRSPGFCDRAASFSSQIAFARLVLLSRGILRPGTAEADRFAREAFAELVAHEVGHALGFPHNWKASTIARWEDVAAGRLTGRVAEGIFSSSVMDYDPIYLAPRDAPQGDYFMQEVGPYDDLQVEYIYRPFDGLTPEAEARELDAIAARAEVEPGLVYDSGELGAIDPTSNADDFGDDPLAFADSRLTILHTEVLPRLPELVLAEGHDYNLLRQALDAAVFSVAMDYIDMTARHVGGQILLRRVAFSPAAPAGGPPPISPVAPAVQRRALDVLDRQVFADGLFALPPEWMAQLKADLLFDWNYPWRYASDYELGDRVAGLYEAALATLLEPARLARVLDNERRTPAGAEPFTLPELFAHLEASAFDGTASGRPLSADRRALQRLLVGHLAQLTLTPAEGTPAEASQVAAWTLGSIARRLEAGPEAADGYTRAHLAELAARIHRTLEAGVELPAGG